MGLDGRSSNQVIDNHDKLELAFDRPTLRMFTEFIANTVEDAIPGFKYWEVAKEDLSWADGNLKGHQQRAWEFYWTIRTAIQRGGLCLGIGTGGVGSPGELTTDKFCGVQIEPITDRYADANGFANMTLNADEIPWPFHDRQFWGVFFNHSFEHVVNPEAVIRESMRVTRTGGYLGIIQPDVTYCGLGQTDPTHVREFGGDEFLDWIHGLQNLPPHSIIEHNTLGNNFSCNTVIRVEG